MFDFLDWGRLPSRQSLVSRLWKLSPSGDIRMRCTVRLLFFLVSAGKIAVCVALCSGSAVAQSDRGGVAGSITDADGAAVSGPLVKAKSLSYSGMYKSSSL